MAIPTEKIRKAIEGMGYPFELRLAKTASECGWSVEQSAFYADPKTKRTREIDLVISAREIDALRPVEDDTDEEAHCAMEVIYTVEAKSRRNKPWVVFTSTVDDTYVDGVDLIAPLPGARILALALEIIGTPRDRDLRKVFPSMSSATIGHGITEVFGSPKARASGPYVAIRSAMNACLALSGLNQKAILTGWSNRLQTVMPLVVTGDDLFECHLDHTGELVVKSVPMCYVQGMHPLRSGLPLIVPIVQEEHWQTFLLSASRDASRLREVTRSEIPDIIESIWTEARSGTEAEGED